MLDEYFSDLSIKKEYENHLMQIFCDMPDNIRKIRVASEIANTIYWLLPSMKNMKFKINDPIMNVIQHNYSKYYLPELEHQNLFEYNKYYTNFYFEIIRFFNELKKIRVLDIGCGIAHVAKYILLEKNNIELYECCDIDKGAIEISSKMLCSDRVKFSNQNILYYNDLSKYSHFIITNFINKLDIHDMKLLLKKILDSGNNAHILVYDTYKINNEIIKYMKSKQKYGMIYGNFLIY